MTNIRIRAAVGALTSLRALRNETLPEDAEAGNLSLDLVGEAKRLWFTALTGVEDVADRMADGTQTTAQITDPEKILYVLMVLADAAVAVGAEASGLGDDEIWRRTIDRAFALDEMLGGESDIL